VVLDDARGVAGTALALARVDAAVVDARLVGGAAAVLQADGHAGLALLVAHADGLVLQHLAGLAGGAVAGLAGVLAGVVDAGEVDRTFGVAPAGHLPFRAGQVSGGGDDQLVLASAGGLVAPRHALLVGVANGGVAARGVALPAVAVEACVAVVIVRALLACGGLLYDRAGALGIGLALDVGLAHETLRALAPWPVQDNPTDGVLSAGRPQGAGILAGATVAGFVQGALVITLASALVSRCF